MYIQVNIGRNFGVDRFNPYGGEHSEFDWDIFITTVRLIIEGHREHAEMGGDLESSVHMGYGYWEGKREESAYISMWHEGGFDVDGIREQLYRLKNVYNQDAIALIVGSELI